MSCRPAGLVCSTWQRAQTRPFGCPRAGLTGPAAPGVRAYGLAPWRWRHEWDRAPPPVSLSLHLAQAPAAELLFCGQVEQQIYFTLPADGRQDKPQTTTCGCDAAPSEPTRSRCPWHPNGLVLASTRCLRSVLSPVAKGGARAPHLGCAQRTGSDLLATLQCEWLASGPRQGPRSSAQSKHLKSHLSRVHTRTPRRVHLARPRHCAGPNWRGLHQLEPVWRARKFKLHFQVTKLGPWCNVSR